MRKSRLVDALPGSMGTASWRKLPHRSVAEPSTALRDAIDVTGGVKDRCSLGRASDRVEVVQVDIRPATAEGHKFEESTVVISAAEIGHAIEVAGGIHRQRVGTVVFHGLGGEGVEQVEGPATAGGSQPIRRGR